MILGVAALLFGAGGVVSQLQTSLNTIWGVVPKSGQDGMRNSRSPQWHADVFIDLYLTRVEFNSDCS